DRVVLMALFTSLFCLHCLVRLFVPDPAPFAPPFPTTEIIGFAAIATVLWSLGADRVLRQWDYAAISIAAVAIIHPWRHVGGLALTGLGALFIARRDRRLASLGQLCVGLSCIDIWGQMALASVEMRLLPIETALAYFPLSFLGPFSLVGTAIRG